MGPIGLHLLQRSPAVTGLQINSPNTVPDYADIKAMLQRFEYGLPHTVIGCKTADVKPDNVPAAQVGIKIDI